MTREELVKLKAATEEVLDVVAKNRQQRGPGEAINWRHLRCVQASWVITNNGNEYAEVLIEDAGPDCCPIFQETVREELRKRGWTNVSVVTEW